MVLDAAPAGMDQPDSGDHQDACAIDAGLAQQGPAATTGSESQTTAPETANDPLQQVLGQNIGDVLIANTADGSQGAPADNAVQVLVASSMLGGADELLHAANSNVITVLYDAISDTPHDILSQIRTELDGRAAQSIAFATHDLGAGAFHLTGGAAVNLATLVTSTDLQQFWTLM